jgi:hypothetical protein
VRFWHLRDEFHASAVNCRYSAVTRHPRQGRDEHRHAGIQGRHTYPTPAAEPNPDGSTTVYFSPTKPGGVNDGNWIQADPKKGWFVALRLFFGKKDHPHDYAMEAPDEGTR